MPMTYAKGNPYVCLQEKDSFMQTRTSNIRRPSKVPDPSVLGTSRTMSRNTCRKMKVSNVAGQPYKHRLAPSQPVDDSRDILGHVAVQSGA